MGVARADAGLRGGRSFPRREASPTLEVVPEGLGPHVARRSPTPRHAHAPGAQARGLQSTAIASGRSSVRTCRSKTFQDRASRKIATRAVALAGRGGAHERTSRRERHGGADRPGRCASTAPAEVRYHCRGRVPAHLGLASHPCVSKPFRDRPARMDNRQSATSRRRARAAASAMRAHTRKPQASKSGASGNGQRPSRLDGPRAGYMAPAGWDGSSAGGRRGGGERAGGHAPVRLLRCRRQ
jgi:hypothetical protein